MKSNVVDRQTIVLSFNLTTLLPSIAEVPINLRFKADELVVKSLSYSLDAVADVPNMVQIWCNKTVDNLIATFPNAIPISVHHDTHFRLSNSLQNETITIEFQKTQFSAPSFQNPQQLISPGNAVGDTKGIVCLTLEFLKLENKEIY